MLSITPTSLVKTKINTINKDVSSLIFKEIHRFYLKTVNHQYDSTFGHWARTAEKMGMGCPFYDEDADYVVCGYRKRMMIGKYNHWVRFDDSRRWFLQQNSIINFRYESSTGKNLPENY